MARARKVARERPAQPQVVRRCRGCDRELASPSDVGWECECGVVVCSESVCIEEYFKFVAGGEATRCLSCGLLM
jgi:hypothetical protein